MISYQAAIDEMFAKFYTAWQTLDVGLGYVPETRWQGIEVANEPDKSKYWVRVSQQTVDENQSTFRQGSSGRRFTTEGLIFVQLFCPKSDSQAMTTGRKLATIARDAFRAVDSSDNIWFRNSRIVELSPENEWRRFNIVAEYEYDEEG